MRESLDQDYYQSHSPKEVRDGPLKERSCTDKLCLIMYILIVLLICGLAVFCVMKSTLQQQSIQEKLKKDDIGKPILSILYAQQQIVLSLAFTIAICFILMITTLIFPSIVVYMYIPLILLSMLLLSVVFFMRYFGNYFPFFSKSIQDKYVQTKSNLALGVGIIFALGFILSIITIFLKRQRFKNVLPVLQIAKIFFWQNIYSFFVAILLSVISIALLFGNIFLLSISQNRKVSEQYHFLNNKVLAGIIIIQLLWTHGFMQSLSDFVYQSYAVNWYFNQKIFEGNYSRFGHNFCSTFYYVFKHLGTIVTGSILAYVPDFINLWFSSFQQGAPTIYKYICCIHKCTCRKLSRYSHTQTILRGLGFCQATDEMFSLRRRAKTIIPELYFVGQFYSTLAKILITLLAIVICFVLLLQLQKVNFNNLVNLITPLLIVALGSLQIATHFMNNSGLIGDTIVLLYIIDFQVERMHYNDMDVYSCPIQVKQIIKEVRGRYNLYD